MMELLVFESKRHVSRVFRSWIVYQLNAYKRMQGPTYRCSLSDLVFDEQQHPRDVHHEGKEFKEILEDFLRDQGLQWPFQLKGRYLYKIRRLWAQYHQRTAVLSLVNRRAHILHHQGKSRKQIRLAVTGSLLREYS